MTLLRLYAPDEAHRDGYPEPWNTKKIPDLVREQAGHRCIRSGHPYRKGEHGSGEWSPCDERCSHDGPLRIVYHEEVEPITHEELSSGLTAADLVHQHAPLARIEARWRILTVHHLNGNKLDCRWWNLTALCQRDHLEIQGRVRMHRAWPWEHSAWMKPYVAGFYAWKYGGEELSRPEVEAHLEELLDPGRREEAVERMPL